MEGGFLDSRERPSHVETPKVFTEQGWNRWFMQIRRRRIAQMLKNGRLKICESVRPAIGETVARNTRNKSADVSDGSSFSSRRRPIIEGLRFPTYSTVYLHATPDSRSCRRSLTGLISRRERTNEKGDEAVRIFDTSSKIIVNESKIEVTDFAKFSIMRVKNSVSLSINSPNPISTADNFDSISR